MTEILKQIRILRTGAFMEYIQGKSTAHYFCFVMKSGFMLLDAWTVGEMRIFAENTVSFPEYSSKELRSICDLF
jgi:hypothetical protein